MAHWIIIGLVVSFVIAVWLDKPHPHPPCAEADYDCRYEAFQWGIGAMPRNSGHFADLAMPSEQALDRTIAHLTLGDGYEASQLLLVLDQLPPRYKKLACAPDRFSIILRRRALVKVNKAEFDQNLSWLGCPAAKRIVELPSPVVHID